MRRATKRPCANLIYLLLVFGFFGIAILFVRACELILGSPRPMGDESRP